MRTIYKYPLEVADLQTLALPEGAQILDVQVQNHVPCLWALVDPDAPRVARSFHLYGTGYPMMDVVGQYVGTFQLPGLVFHLFEVNP